jgi:hypothetical protein
MEGNVASVVRTWIGKEENWTTEHHDTRLGIRKKQIERRICGESILNVTDRRLMDNGREPYDAKVSRTVLTGGCDMKSPQ